MQCLCENAGGHTWIRPRGITKASPEGLTHCVSLVIVSSRDISFDHREAQELANWVLTVVVASVFTLGIRELPPFPLSLTR